MSITSDELNYLVWRYLQEAGFEHTTYAFQREAGVHHLDKHFSSRIPLGALVNVAQKGIQFMEVEASVKEDGTIVDSEDKPFSLFGNDYVRSGTPEITEEELKTDTLALKGAATALLTEAVDTNRAVAPPALVPVAKTPMTDSATNTQDTQNAASQKDMTRAEVPIISLTPSVDVGSVSQCQWSPVDKSVLLTGAAGPVASLLVLSKGDETTEEPSGALLPTHGDEMDVDTEDTHTNNDSSHDGAVSTKMKVASSTNLAHSPIPQGDKDITAVSWNRIGTLCVTAAFDGQLRLWTAQGKLRHILSLHRAPILSVRWNKTGSLVLSIDCTNTLVVWDTTSGEVRHHLSLTVAPPPASAAVSAVSAVVGDIQAALGGKDENHESAESITTGFDADWIDGLTFVMTGEMHSIVVCRVGEKLPLLVFKGHSAGINDIQFDHVGLLLASASDDHSVRLWQGRSVASTATLLGHTAPVMVVRWLPLLNAANLVGGANIGTMSLVVSASLDGTARVWLPENGRCLAVLALHESAIFAMEISPDRKWLATGGMDGVLVLWDLAGIEDNGSTEEGAGRALARLEVGAPIDCIGWNLESDVICVGTSGKSFVVEWNASTREVKV
ncbi:F-box-like/WD repeat-containing protein TBL1X [Yarrowia sp. C11]|nr:F-box-like/WD repeat-containing protein TBL1X [Yarrowia sp. C11]KAG5364670.1 F-box-like/WD repeat-containing protein TBL1X [Yarrowia sp. E02]